MSWIDTNYKLSNLNALLGSTLGYANDRENGASVGDATANFGMNIFSGALRNEVAYDLRKTTGSNLGFLINGMAGYGNQEANAKGTAGLMAASFMAPFMSPYGGYGPFGGGMFGYGPFGGGMFGGGYMGGGGCCCNNGYMGGMPYMGMPYMGQTSMFIGNGFFC